MAERPGVPNGIRTRVVRQGNQGVGRSFTRRNSGAGALLALLLLGCDVPGQTYAGDRGALPTSPLAAKDCAKLTSGGSICTVELAGLRCVVTLGGDRRNYPDVPTALWCERRHEGQR